MSTTQRHTKSASAASLATSAKFKTFAIVFSLAAPVVYVLCEIFWPAAVHLPSGDQPR